MAGILESLFDDGGWQQVLGIAPKPPAPTPQPPPFALNQAGPTFSPTSTFDSGGQLSFNDRAAPVQTAIQEGVFKPMPVGMTQRDVPLGLPGVSPPQPYTTYPDQNQPSPAATAVMPTANGGALPPPALTPQEPLPPVTMPLPSGTDAAMPLKVSAPPMPPPMRGDVPTSGGGGLMAALGLATPEARQAALAGVGRGLSAVGQMRSGAPRGAAIATGLGGAIQGQQAKSHEQLEDQLKAKKEAFTEDLQTKNYDINRLNSAIRTRQQEAQIPWWQARTEVLQAQRGQSAASKAWQMSEPGKYHTVETEVQKHQAALIQLYRDELKQASLDTDPEKSNKIRDVIKKDVEQFRSERYKFYGLDPSKKDETMKKGFVPEGSPQEQERVIKYLPPGTRYWDAKSGQTRIRHVDDDNRPIGADMATAAAMPSAATAAVPAEAE